MFYRLFGWWIRMRACEMASRVMQGQGFGTDDEGPCPRLWSCTVLFEQYILCGAEGTHEDFGPKDPVSLHPVQELNSP